MYKIDNSTAATAAPATPAVGPNPGGHFTSGNPGASPAVPATTVDAYWLETVQAELCNVVTGAGIVLDKTNQSQLASAIGATPKGRLLNVQTFTASGTYTATPGTSKIRVTVVGGGGAAGGLGATGSNQFSVSGGGQSGAYGQGLITSGFSGATVTVGAAGTGLSGVIGGNPGGTSSFGTFITAPGGAGGGSVAASSGAVNAGGGTGGAIATGGSILNIRGGYGASGSGQCSAGFGYGGAGGSNPLGFGGSWGNPGVGFGSGAGGSINIQSLPAASGLNGQSGIVIVEEFS